MKLILLTLGFCSIFSYGYSWRFFHDGRVDGDNVYFQPRQVLNDEPKNYSEWFTQNLDHFDVGNQETWQQRYFVNDEFLDQEKRNVAFLMIDGESAASDIWMTDGAWINYAKNSNAILFDIEHRFYGKSQPTKDLTLENLKYLTSNQALADVAIFVDAMNDHYNLSSEVKWIAFGGSYAGALAAWARVKYPHLIHGVVSTSAPLLAIPDFQDYYKVVSDDMSSISKNCVTAVKTGTAQITDLLQNKGGQRTITELFDLCNPLDESVDIENDISSFYSGLAGNFAGMAQYPPNMTPLGSLNLVSACNIMSNVSEGQEINRLAKINSLILQAYKQTCIGINYSKITDALKDVYWDAYGFKWARQWLFQTCNEFGYYATSDKKPHIFGDKFPIDFYVQQCIDIFGPKFNRTYLDAATNRTNIFYGALEIEATNVAYVHGSVDPWHALGITTNLNQGATVIFINGTGHCADLIPESDSDLPQLKAARVEIGQLIQTWLDL